MRSEQEMRARKASPPGFPDGVYAASVTPLTDDYRVDTALYFQHVQWLLDQGCDGVVLMGTTGEANSLALADRQAALEAVLAAGVAPHRLVVGTGLCSLHETAVLTQHAVRCGVGGVLLLPPFYYKDVGDDGLFAAYDHVIQQVGAAELRVMLYHIPPVSYVGISHTLLERLLARYPANILAMKDSGGDFEHMRSVRREFPQLRLFAGTERYLLDVLRIGGVGCISAAGNVSCAQAARVYRAWQQGDPQVEAQQRNLSAIRDKLQQWDMIPALKAWTAQRTGNATWRRVCPPLVPLENDAFIDVQV